MHLSTRTGATRCSNAPRSTTTPAAPSRSQTTATSPTTSSRKTTRRSAGRTKGREDQGAEVTGRLRRPPGFDSAAPAPARKQRASACPGECNRVASPPSRPRSSGPANSRPSAASGSQYRFAVAVVVRAQLSDQRLATSDWRLTIELCLLRGEEKREGQHEVDGEQLDALVPRRLAFVGDLVGD